MFEKIEPGDEESLKRVRLSLGPQHLDHSIRQAIQLCWMALPPEKQNVDEVERQLRRVFERAIRDLREDASQFGESP